MLFGSFGLEAKNAYEFTPGRIIIFNGTVPHSIRPQSFNAPQYRFTVSTFFKDKI